MANALHTALDFIITNEWSTKLLCFVLCIISVIIVSVIKKVVVKHRAKKENVDKRKMEYPLSIIAFVIAYGLIFAFLYVHGTTSLWQKFVTAGYSAVGTQGAYVLVCQPTRKGLKKLATFIFNIFKKAKEGKITVDYIQEEIDILTKVDEVVETEDVTVTANTEQPIEVQPTTETMELEIPPLSAVDKFYKSIEVTPTTETAVDKFYKSIKE